ncbi:hypothetical protein UR09_06020 [Candidatus Nitromaritima sp. SCGC AAA799-A02]|nr:hypothetical protein UR09_06020 [Candidatus Nitromaritima sp. SCGC AAA799-A02]
MTKESPSALRGSADEAPVFALAFAKCTPDLRVDPRVGREPKWVTCYSGTDLVNAGHILPQGNPCNFLVMTGFKNRIFNDFKFFV